MVMPSLMSNFNQNLQKKTIYTKKTKGSTSSRLDTNHIRIYRKKIYTKKFTNPKKKIYKKTKGSTSRRSDFWMRRGEAWTRQSQEWELRFSRRRRISGYTWPFFLFFGFLLRHGESLGLQSRFIVQSLGL
jgi:hypothetical protein